MKKDKNRLEELLSLREREVQEYRVKVESSQIMKEKKQMEQRMENLEKEYKSKIEGLNKVNISY